jgi:5-methylcytosine-specific restriction endonuclease McrA
MRVYQKEARRVPQVRISLSVSRRIWEVLRGVEGKQSRRWESLVGYTKEELMAHLERQFLRGMSWDNYGEWHVDHIVPLSSFNFASAADPEFKRAWALSNLRPLWASENIRKNAKRVFLI